LEARLQQLRARCDSINAAKKRWREEAQERDALYSAVHPLLLKGAAAALQHIAKEGGTSLYERGAFGFVHRLVLLNNNLVCELHCAVPACMPRSEPHAGSPGRP
jgi:hypothetical protein